MLVPATAITSKAAVALHSLNLNMTFSSTSGIPASSRNIPAGAPAEESRYKDRRAYTERASASMADVNGADRCVLQRLPPASTSSRANANVIDASATTYPDMVVNVSQRDAWAWVARADALITATGLSMSSPLATSQSSAFFNTPDTPCAYSGLEIRIASLV